MLEALASGLPVIGLDADGTRDLVQHERSGLLLQYKPNRLNSSVRQWNEQLTPGSPSFQALSQQYAALLRRLVQNVTLRGVMGEFALTSTPVGKSWDSAMGCMVECYHEVARTDRREVLRGLDCSWLHFGYPISVVAFIFYLAFFLVCIDICCHSVLST